jgi:putative MATE family efflux protein
MQVQTDLVEAPIGRALRRFSTPILLAVVLQSLNASVNSVWVGRLLGATALAATANANGVMGLLIGVAFGLAMAASIVIAQHMGAKNVAAAKRVVGTSATLFTALSLALAAAGLACSEPLLVLLRTPASALPQAVSYMRVIFLAVPCSYLYAFVMSALRGAGDSKTPFRFSLLSVAIDVVLNPLFIYGAGPIPRLGIAGSALATVSAQAISLAALLVSLYRDRHPLALHKIEFALLRVDWAIVGALVRKGIPMSAQILVTSLSGVAMIALVNGFGVDMMAAFGASLQIWSYTLMPAGTLGMGVAAMAAQNAGAGRWDRVHAVARVGVGYGVLSTAAFVAVVGILSPTIYGLFLPPGSPAIAIGEHINEIAGPSFILFSVALVLFGVMQATGAVRAPLAIVVVALFGVRWPFAEVLRGHWHANAIWWSFPISSIVAAALAGAYYKYAIRRRSWQLLGE